MSKIVQSDLIAFSRGDRSKIESLETLDIDDRIFVACHSLLNSGRSFSQINCRSWLVAHCGSVGISQADFSRRHSSVKKKIVKSLESEKKGFNQIYDLFSNFDAGDLQEQNKDFFAHWMSMGAYSYQMISRSIDDEASYSLNHSLLEENSLLVAQIDDLKAEISRLRAVEFAYDQFKELFKELEFDLPQKVT